MLSLVLGASLFERPAYPADGFTVSEESAHVHVLMPSRPEAAVKRTSDVKSKSGGHKLEHLWKVIWNGGLWAASSTVLPRDVAYDALPEIARKIIKASDAVEVDRQPVLLDGVQGLEFLFKDSRFINRWRIFLIDPQTLVDIRYVGEPGTENAKEVERYFASFALKGGPRAAPDASPAPPASAKPDLLDRLKGRTIKVTGLLGETDTRKRGEKPFIYKDEYWPLTLKVRDDGLIAWSYSDPTCPVDGEFKRVEILFGNREGETPIIPGYRKEQVRCSGDSSGRWGLFSSTLQGSYTTVRLVSGNVLSLTQEFTGSAKRKTSGGRKDVATTVDYRTRFNVSISFGDSSCEVVKVDWSAGSTEKDPDDPGRPTEISRIVRIAPKTYCVIR